jgi:hypothetical protein
MRDAVGAQPEPVKAGVMGELVNRGIRGEPVKAGSQGRACKYGSYLQAESMDNEKRIRPGRVK